MADDGHDIGPVKSSFKFPSTPGMPLFALSPERVNIPRQSPSPSPPRIIPGSELKSPAAFGHPEFGPPGDFSKFDACGGNGDFKVPASAPRLAQSPSRSHVHSPTAMSENGNTRCETPSWDPPKLHSRTNSDVQGMVARFNSLDIRDHAEMRKKDAAALKRAQMGREEAEDEVKRLKEEARALKKEIEEGKDREKRVVKRLDVMMEDLHRSKETQAHAQSLYEKEIRKARKEAFKSSSTLVKLQEELKIARKALGVVQSDLDLERIKGNRKDQDAFNAQYQLVGVQEELAQAQSRTKVVEEERDALKMSLKEEEVARIAAEGKIALPTTERKDDEFGTPKLYTPVYPSQSPSKAQARNKQDLEGLNEQLEFEIRRREVAEEQAEFLKLECQFGCCACRNAESGGDTFTFDNNFEEEIQRFKRDIRSVLTPLDSLAGEDHRSETLIEEKTRERTPVPDFSHVDASGLDDAGAFQDPPSNDASQHLVMDSECATEAPDARFGGDKSNTVVEVPETEHTKRPSSELEPPRPFHQPPETVENDYETAQDRFSPNDEHDIEHNGHEPSGTPHVGTDEPDAAAHHSFRTVTTTTKVPLADASTPDYSAFCTPMKLTREEAIEQLRQRRGRARSVAGTPKKPTPEDRTPRRDISAPEASVKARQVSKRLG